VRVKTATKVGLAVAAIAVGCALILVIASPGGLHVNSDSASYFDAARSLAHGKGLVLEAPPPNHEPQFHARSGVPLVHWAPLFPTTLAGLSPLWPDPLDAARWLIVALFAANIALVGRIAWRATDRNALAAVAAAAFFALSPAGISLHGAALSEPLFLFLSLLGLELTAVFLQSGRRWALAAAGCSIAAALLTRYVGLPLVVAVWAALLLFEEGTLRRRLARSTAFAVAVSLPLVAWLIRNAAVADSAADRRVELDPPSIHQLSKLLGSFAHWFGSNSLGTAARAVLALALCVVVAALWVLLRRSSPLVRARPARIRLTLMLVFGVVYLISLYVWQTLFDTSFGDRALAPAYASLVVVATWLVSTALDQRRRPVWAVGVLIGGIIGVGLAYGQQSLHAANNLHRRRLGYEASEWQRSPTLQRVRQADRRIPVYSNAPEAINLLTGRPALSVPTTIDPTTSQPNPGYEASVSALRRRGSTEPLLVAYFDDVPRQRYVVGPDELARRTGLRLQRTSDGVVLASRRTR
jgi:4-amino-4-deoxy-L-arabinose transferase-like glycosyltransferase